MLHDHWRTDTPASHRAPDDTGRIGRKNWCTESGLVVNLKRSILEKLAIVLDTTPTYLMGMEDSAQQANVQLAPQQSTLLAVFDQLNEEGQEKVIGYAEDLNRTGYYKKQSPNVMVTKEA